MPSVCRRNSQQKFSEGFIPLFLLPFVYCSPTITCISLYVSQVRFSYQRLFSQNVIWLPWDKTETSNENLFIENTEREPFCPQNRWSLNQINYCSFSWCGSKETPYDLARPSRYKIAMLQLHFLIRDLFSLKKIMFFLTEILWQKCLLIKQTQAVHFKTMKTEKIIFGVRPINQSYFFKSWIDCRDSQCFKSFKRESNQESRVFLMPPAVPVWNKY